MKHTPPPWAWGNYSEEVSCDAPDLAELVAYGPEDSNGSCSITPVLEIEVNGEFFKVTAANARLIAAAPELLEACKEHIIRLTDLFDRHERPTYSRDAQSDLDLILASGLAAIAKAEGK